jgi:hypothetical protein
MGGVENCEKVIDMSDVDESCVGFCKRFINKVY